MDYRRRFPDKPNLMSAAQLPVFDLQGGWIATLKQDGWRCMIEIDESGKLQFLSRVWKPLPIGQPLREIVAAMHLPKATVLDTEWSARRPNHQGQETLHLIGVHWYDGEWLGAKPESERWAMATTLMGRAPNPPGESIFSPCVSTDREYSKLFEFSKTIPATEGIVLKRNNSTMIGDLRDSKNNPAWIKIKWRAGHDGQTVIA